MQADCRSLTHVLLFLALCIALHCCCCGCSCCCCYCWMISFTCVFQLESPNWKCALASALKLIVPALLLLVRVIYLLDVQNG